MADDEHSHYALVKYDTACRALAEARSVDEVKEIRDRAMALALYARQAKNSDLEADACEIRLRAERRLGEMMAVQPKATGGDAERVARGIQNPEVRPTLSVAGIDKNLAKRARLTAAIPVDEFERYVDERRIKIASASLPRGAFGTQYEEWHTPGAYIELARAVLGAIDLDPASSDVAQATVNATRWFTAEDD